MNTNNRIEDLTNDLLRRSLPFVQIVASRCHVNFSTSDSKLQVIANITRSYTTGAISLAAIQGAVNLTPDDGIRGRVKSAAPTNATAPSFAQQLQMPAAVSNAGATAIDQEADALSAAITAAVKNALKAPAPTIDKAAILELIKQELQNLPNGKIDITINEQVTKTLEGYTRPELKEILKLAALRLNILLIGAAGSGKTHLAQQVAKAFDMRFGSISCSAGMSESHLSGWLLPTGDNGRFEYVRSVFVDIYENGGVFLFDEIDAADSNTLLFINQALANGGFFVPQRHEAPEVKKHKDCIIIAAANTFGTGSNIAYSGRERLDESTLDRFRAGQVYIDYDTQLEKNLVNTDLLSWGHEARRKINDAKLQRVLSTRFLIDGSKRMVNGASLSDIKETFFMGWREDERRKAA